MVRKDLLKKIGSLVISILLVSLIFLILVPPATAVKLNPGTPSSTTVCNESTITFSNVNLTIRGEERIPVDFLNFSILNNETDQCVAYVTFYIDGTEITDSPSNKFTVTKTTTINDSWYNYGYGYGYDEGAGQPYYFGYGYGYGRGNASYSDITILYNITYTTHTAGTFYTKLYVNSTSHTYTSAASSTFTVINVPWDGDDVSATIAEVIDGSGTVNATSVAEVSVDVSGTGTTTVAVANYTDNPGSVGLSSTGSFFDIYIPDVTGVTSITIKHWVTSTPDANHQSLYYWNTTLSSWRSCSNTGYTAQASGSYVGYIYATISSTTHPNLDDLTGLPFNGGEVDVVALNALAEEYYKQGDTVAISGYIIPATENIDIGIEVNDSANQSMFDVQVKTNSTGHFSTSFILTTGSEGVATIYASVGSTRVNQTFTYDKTAPTSTISNPSDGAKFNDLATISGTASDGTSGVTQVEIQIANSTHYWNSSAWVATAAWLTATGTTSWSYDTSSVDWVACGADASITIKSRATDNANNVETPGAGNTWTYGITTSITTTAGDIGGYHGFNITWNDVSMSKYKVYYDTSAITDTSGLTAKATVTGATTYECEDMPSGTWGQTIYFAVTTVDSNDVEANSTFIGNTPSSKIWAFKMEITGLQEIHNTTGEIGWEMHYKNRYLNDSLSGKAILECLGPGTHPNVPNNPQWIARSSMSVSSFLETGQRDAYISKTYATGDYKGWNMLWSCLPSESGYWEPYATLYEYSPITVS